MPRQRDVPRVKCGPCCGKGHIIEAGVKEVCSNCDGIAEVCQKCYLAIWKCCCYGRQKAAVDDFDEDEDDMSCA